MIIVTSSSKDYFNYLKNFLYTLDIHRKDSKIIIYDLGLLPDQLAWLKDNKYNVRNFNFDPYPNFIRLDNTISDTNNTKNRIKKGCSVFKSIIINNLLHEFKDIILWLDCRINITGQLTELENIINKNGFYFPTFNNKIVGESTHPFTLKYLNVDNDICSQLLLVNQIMGWNYKKEGILFLSDDFKNYCLTENWIKPVGANDLNHSFEYSILSILFYQYKRIYNFNFEELPSNKLNLSLLPKMCN